MEAKIGGRQEEREGERRGWCVCVCVCVRFLTSVAEAIALAYLRMHLNSSIAVVVYRCEHRMECAHMGR